MSWVVGQRYRGKVVAGQMQIERIQSTGTPSAVGMVECSAGEQSHQRLRWRGWLNNPKNAEETTAELRAMGWTGARLGDWKGIGSKEFEFSVMADEGTDGKTYYRAAFIRPVATLKGENKVDETDLDELNAQLGAILAPPVNGAAPQAARSPVPLPPDAQDGGTREIPF